MHTGAQSIIVEKNYDLIIDHRDVIFSHLAANDDTKTHVLKSPVSFALKSQEWCVLALQIKS